MKKSLTIIAILLLIMPFTAFAAGCPLGPNVTADLAGALKIMKILGPIFAIGYTLYEGIVALTKGGIDAEGKKLFAKFAKRIMAAALLFAVPVLVDSIMQIMNVWDKDGHCVIEEVSSGSPQDSGQFTTRGAGSVDAGDLTNDKSASGSLPNNDKSASGSVGNNDKHVDAGKISNDKNASGQMKDNTNQVQIDDSTSPIRIEVN